MATPLQGIYKGALTKAIYRVSHQGNDKTVQTVKDMLAQCHTREDIDDIYSNKSAFMAAAWLGYSAIMDAIWERYKDVCGNQLKTVLSNPIYNSLPSCNLFMTACQSRHDDIVRQVCGYYKEAYPKCYYKIAIKDGLDWSQYVPARLVEEEIFCDSDDSDQASAEDDNNEEDTKPRTRRRGKQSCTEMESEKDTKTTGKKRKADPTQRTSGTARGVIQTNTQAPSTLSTHSNSPNPQALPLGTHQMLRTIEQRLEIAHDESTIPLQVARIEATLGVQAPQDGIRAKITWLYEDICGTASVNAEESG